MRIFLAGATGAVGRRLVPLLIKAGHDVVGTSRDPQRRELLEAAGARGVVVDALDRDAVIAAAADAKPDVVINELTALSGPASLRRFDDYFARTNRLRTEGTDNLIAAALASGVPRLVAQSYTGWPNERSGGPVRPKTIRSIRTPPRPRGARWQLSSTWSQRSPARRGSTAWCSATAASTARAPRWAPVESCSRWSTAGGCRSSAPAPGSGPTCTSTTPPSPPSSPSSGEPRGSTTSSTTSPLP